MKYTLALLVLLGSLYLPEQVAALEPQSDVLGVRISRSPGQVRIVFDLSGPIQYKLIALETPPRLILDLQNTQLKTSVSNLPLRGTPISRVYGEAYEKTAVQRLVFNLERAVKTNTFLLKPYLQRGDRLVLDLCEHSSCLQPSTGNQFSPEFSTDSHVSTGRVVTSASVSEGALKPIPEKLTPAPRVKFGGTWEQEWAVETRGVDNQKIEIVIEPRVDVKLAHNLSLSAIGRLRLDAIGDMGPKAYKTANYSRINGPWYNTEYAELSMREVYLDAEWADSFWRIGKQQVVWGQADGLKVLDVVNPQSFREFILDEFDDSRIPLWMVNVEVPVGVAGNMQFLWIPDTTYHELAEPGTPYFLTSSRLVPQVMQGAVLEPDKPDDAFSDGDVGIRYAAFIKGWDITLNYLYHYQDFPVLYQTLRKVPTGLEVVVDPNYERNHLIGGSLSNVFGDKTLRMEFAYNTDTFHVSSDLSNRGIEESAELASVIGLDWQLGSDDIFISTQWFQSHLVDYRGAVHRDETESNISFLYQQNYDHETWQFNALILYSPNHRDSWVQLKLNYLMESNQEIWLGADLFQGNSDGLYGQFVDQDRVVVGMEYSF